MSTLQAETQKRSRKGPRKGPPTNMRAAVSETEASDYPSQNQSQAGDDKPSQRRKSTAKKHNTNYDSAAHSDGPNVRQNHNAPKTHATPIKSQAYAGPTFHQSPAASALPLPSFYSKSLPSNGIMKPVPEDMRPATHNDEVEEITGPPLEAKRESTPLDFLFDAARKAQMTPGSESPQYRFLSPAAAKSPSRSPAPREGDTVFPFEMGSDETKFGNTHSNASTPFRDRLEAVRPGNVRSPGAKQLDEEERRAKTAALKDFLMASSKPTEMSENPFNARPAPQYQQSWQHQQNSNAGTPTHPIGGNQPNQQYFPHYMYGQHNQGSPIQRHAGSNLRNIYAPEIGPHSMAIPPGEQFQHSSSAVKEQIPVKQPYQGYHTPPQDASPQRRVNEHKSTPSAQQLEDDLRRVLKLDLASQG